MAVNSTLAISVSASIISLTVMIFTIWIAILLMTKYAQKTQQTKGNDKESHTAYFKITSEAAVILNSLCTISCSLYTIWVTFDPPTDDGDNSNNWFIALRAVPTIFWWSSKVSIIYLYNGRLYYTFLRSVYRTERWFFIFINVLVAVAAPVSIICGFIGVNLGNKIMITTSFQGFRTLYVVLTLILVIMFSKKMLLLQRNCYSVLANKSMSETTCNAEEIEMNSEEDKDILFYLEIATKNAVLA
eukprot:870704_1